MIRSATSVESLAITPGSAQIHLQVVATNAKILIIKLENVLREMPRSNATSAKGRGILLATAMVNRLLVIRRHNQRFLSLNIVVV